MRETFKNNIDTSGKMFKKQYLAKYYTDTLENINQYIIENNLTDLPFKQQVYHWLNEINHIIKCKECDKKVKFKNSTIGYYTFCSKKCMNKSNITKNKRINTNIKNFGTKTPSESEIIKNKIIQTNIKKYGHNCSLQNKKVNEKSKNTLKKNYNVDNPLKSKIILDKLKNTNLKKYQVDNVLKSDKIKKKIQNTLIERYGVNHAMKNKKIANKMINTLYDTLNEKLLKHYKEYNILNINNTDRIYTMECKAKHKFDITYILLNSRRKTNTEICTICNPINKSISGLQIQLLNFIKENYNKEIIINDRNIIKIELDIYLPDLKLAFEFNGLYWHNELYKSKNYHKNKTDLCEENDIQLIHIYEDDWIYKQDIVKSMILNKLGKTPNKIYARKTEIREITDNKLVREFLNRNHIQGFVGSKVKIGLFYKDELVNLIVFGKNRRMMSNGDNNVELLRFCNKLNTNVIGGASKLFKYFIKKYDFKNIITYADRNHSNGKLYEILGFDFIHKTKPNYYYIVDKIKQYRFNFRKDILVKKGFNKNKSEHEIMLERGIYRIYNSGNIKYNYLKNIQK